MLKALKWFFGLFSQYVHPFEKKVDKFFRSIKSTDSHLAIERDLLKLMQEDLVILSVWLEKKFKGYRYLKKSVRRKMHENVRKIVVKFEEFCRQNNFSREKVREILQSYGLVYPAGEDLQIEYLVKIMAFLKPGNFFNYVEAANFGRLLSDLEHQKMEGDCNQIVTFYAYLYSLKFPIYNLQIKLLTDHVCLHFKGIDIEATSGEFKHYQENRQVLPITEIVSTNLLDVADFREIVHEVLPEDMVKASQLAYAISSLKSVVEGNLKIAYHNLTLAALKNKDFKKAKFYADLTRDDELRKVVRHNEGIYYFDQENFPQALKIFAELEDREMQKACYSRQYNQLVRQVKNDQNLTDLKRHKSIYQQMLDLARKMGDSQLEQNVKEVLKQI